jgi:hypothetical protein
MGQQGKVARSTLGRQNRAVPARCCPGRAKGNLRVFTWSKRCRIATEVFELLGASLLKHQTDVELLLLCRRSFHPVPRL